MRHQLSLCLLLVLLVTLAVTERDQPRRGRRQGGRRDRQGLGPGGPMMEGGRRGREMREFLLTLQGRFDNANQVSQEEENGVAQDQRHPNLILSFMPVQIDYLRPPTRGVFFQAQVAPGRNIVTLHTYEPRGRAHILNRAWVLKQPDDFVDGWNDPGLFKDLQPNDAENDLLRPLPSCEVQFRRQEDDSYVTAGTGHDCRIPLQGYGEGAYQHIGASTLTPGSYTYNMMIHQADGTMVRELTFRLDKISAYPGEHILGFDRIKEAMVGGATASYRLDLRRCNTDTPEYSPHIIGGPIDEYQYVPAGVFGPLGYIRAASHSLAITLDYRRIRMTTLHIYENRDVQFMLDESTLGDREPAPPKLFNCTMDSGPRGFPIVTLRWPRHFRQLHDVTAVGMALMAGFKVRMTVDLSLCDRHDNDTDIITQGGTMVRDHDMLLTEDRGRIVSFNTVAIGKSLPNCVPGAMMSGASAFLQENTNSVTLHQWGILFSDFGTCFQVAYECQVSGPRATEGTTFFLV